MMRPGRMRRGHPASTRGAPAEAGAPGAAMPPPPQPAAPLRSRIRRWVHGRSRCSTVATCRARHALVSRSAGVVRVVFDGGFRGLGMCLLGCVRRWGAGGRAAGQQSFHEAAWQQATRNAEAAFETASPLDGKHRRSEAASAAREVRLVGCRPAPLAPPAIDPCLHATRQPLRRVLLSAALCRLPLAACAEGTRRAAIV